MVSPFMPTGGIPTGGMRPPFDVLMPPPDDLAALAAEQRASEQAAAERALAAPPVAAPAPMAPPPRPQGIDPMELARAREADAAAIAASAQRPPQSFAVQNPMHAPVQRFVTGTQQAQDISAVGALGGVEAQREAAIQEAGLQERANREAQTEAAVMAAKERVRLDDERQALEVAREQDKAVAGATKQLQDMPSFATTWEDKGAGQKVALFFSAIASAMTAFGSAFTGVPARDFVQEALENDRQAYQMKRAALGQNVDAARMRRDDSYSILDRVRQAGQSEREADLLHQRLRLDQMDGEFRKMLAENKVKVLTAQQQELLGAIEEKRAATNLELDRLRITNPERKIVRAAANKEAEFYRKKAFEHSLKRSGELEDVALKGQVPKDVDRVELGRYEKERRPFETLTKKIDAMLSRYGEDIPGYSAIPKVGPDLPSPFANTRKAQQEIDLIVQAYTHALSGAGVSEEEAKRKANAILGGGKTEEELRHGLAVLKEDAAAALDAIELGTTRETAEYYRSRLPEARRARAVPVEKGGDSFFEAD